MERKVGEIFECDGVTLCVEQESQACQGCYFNQFEQCYRYRSVRGECQSGSRSSRGVIFRKVEDMESRTVKLTLEKAKEFYKKDGEFRDLALSAFTEEELTKVELPKTWEEFCSQFNMQYGEYYIYIDSSIKENSDDYRNSIFDRNMLPSKKAAEAHLALMQLHQLRDCYRQGWKPDSVNNQCKHSIIFNSNTPEIVPSFTCNCFLSFQSEEIAKLFLKNFRSLIEEAGDLI